MIEIVRRMTPAQRLHRSFELRACTLRLARARILQKHPDATPREVQLRLASLWLDAETMRRVWGWDPVIQGY
jgi:hypothetical protein